MFKKTNIFFYTGLFIVIFFITIALCAPLITKYSPTHIDMNQVLMSPTFTHPFGTDELGRDVFSRVIYGTRVSLLVSSVAVLISIIVGTILGLLSGYFKGFTDIIIFFSYSSQ